MMYRNGCIILGLTFMISTLQGMQTKYGITVETKGGLVQLPQSFIDNMPYLKGIIDKQDLTNLQLYGLFKDQEKQVVERFVRDHAECVLKQPVQQGRVNQERGMETIHDYIALARRLQSDVMAKIYWKIVQDTRN